MAVRTIATVNRYDYLGLSGDTKPTNNVTEGALFIETDTRAVYRFSGGDWYMMDDKIQYVWNPSTMQKEKMTQPYIDATDSELYLVLDNVESLLTDIRDGLGGGYKISDMDADAEPNYYGFLGKEGEWYILKEENNQYRYCKGDSGYTTAWTNRAIQSYDYYHNTF